MAEPRRAWGFLGGGRTRVRGRGGMPSPSQGRADPFHLAPLRGSGRPLPSADWSRAGGFAVVTGGLSVLKGPLGLQVQGSLGDVGVVRFWSSLAWSVCPAVALPHMLSLGGGRGRSPL